MTFHIRTMMAEDVSAGMSLKTAAGWNQTEADWHRFLRADPAGAFVAEAAGQVVGSVTTMVYGTRLAWVGMMLVDPAHRRKGIGEALMRAALGYLETCGVGSVGLDATPMGRPLYERLGFRAVADLNRWAYDRPPAATAPEPPSPTPGTIDLNALFEQDTEVFGADRSGLIRSFVDAAPERFVVSSLGVSRPDYGLTRPRTLADHIGAWVADEPGGAATVLEALVSRSTAHRVIADVPSDHPFAGRLLHGFGFRIARDLTRMFRGPWCKPPLGDDVCAILGPEFG